MLLLTLLMVETDSPTSQAPSSLLEALEAHLAALEVRRTWHHHSFRIKWRNIACFRVESQVSQGLGVQPQRKEDTGEKSYWCSIEMRRSFCYSLLTPQSYLCEAWRFVLCSIFASFFCFSNLIFLPRVNVAAAVNVLNTTSKYLCFIYFKFLFLFRV